MRTSVIVFVGLMLAGCQTSQTASTAATVTSALTTAQAAVNQAVTFYGVAKGIAQVAEAADPTLAAPISTAIAVLDPLVVTAQAALQVATTDAPTLEALAAQIQSQAQALETTAAPAIKVVSSKT